MSSFNGVICTRMDLKVWEDPPILNDVSVWQKENASESRAYAPHHDSLAGQDKAIERGCFFWLVHRFDLSHLKKLLLSPQCCVLLPLV